MFRIHNTLTNEIEEFQPLDPNEVRMYSCGPTVWNFAHIGNFRTFVFGDILRRYLRFKGYNLKHVMNLTDVDDRIISEASKLGITINNLTGRFIEVFWEDLDSLNCERPEIAPRTTEHIAEMIELIQTLIEKGHAYKSEGSVYYRISSFPEYGKLSNIRPEANLPSASERIDADKYKKENAADFALWKAVAAADPHGWDAPFGRGRPGWHIQCSAMAMKYLGETFDIHTGGVDLQFPHHENEIAQSEGATGKPLAKYWLHGEFLQINDEKMSKSLDNVFTLRDIVEHGFSPLAIRYLLLSIPFDKPLNFTPENLQCARVTTERLHDFWRRLEEECLSEGGCFDFQEKVKDFLAEFEAAMDDNLNTAVALAALHNLVREVNIALSLQALRCEDRRVIVEAIEKFDSVFGIFGELKKQILPAEIEKLIEQRKTARRNRNFVRADEIRDALCEQGIILEDAKDGVKWKKK